MIEDMIQLDSPIADLKGFGPKDVYKRQSSPYINGNSVAWLTSSNQLLICFVQYFLAMGL